MIPILNLREGLPGLDTPVFSWVDIANRDRHMHTCVVLVEEPMSPRPIKAADRRAVPPLVEVRHGPYAASDLYSTADRNTRRPALEP